VQTVLKLKDDMREALLEFDDFSRDFDAGRKIK